MKNYPTCAFNALYPKYFVFPTRLYKESPRKIISDLIINFYTSSSRVDNSDVSFLARDCNSKYSGTPPYGYPV